MGGGHDGGHQGDSPVVLRGCGDQHTTHTGTNTRTNTHGYKRVQTAEVSSPYTKKNHNQQSVCGPYPPCMTLVVSFGLLAGWPTTFGTPLFYC